MHELAVGGARHLHRPCLLRGVAHPLHQGDGEGAGGDRVGHRAPRDHPREGARHHRRLGGPSAEVAEEGVGRLDEEVPRPRLLQKGPEEDEEKDKGGRDPQGHAPDPLGGGVELAHELAPLAPGVELEPGGERVGDEALGPGEGVEDEDGGDDGQGGPHHPPARHEEDEEGEGPHDHVPIARDAPSELGDAVVVPDHVKRPQGAEQGQGPVQKGYPVLRAPLPRVGQEGQGQGEGQVYGP